MNSTSRFGRKINTPSTAQIKHELLLRISADKVAISLRGLPMIDGETMEQLTARLAKENGVSPEGTKALVDRVKAERKALANAPDTRHAFAPLRTENTLASNRGAPQTVAG